MNWRPFPGTAALGLLFSLLGQTAEARAQAPNPSATSFGLVGAYTARARGYEAVAWNPANLGLAHRPKWSVGLPSVTAFVANNSWSLGTITGLYGEFLDDERKSRLLGDVRRGDADRMLTLDLDGSAQFLGFSVGRFAISAGTAAGGGGDFASDALEFLLFGNVGQDNEGGDFSFDGTGGTGWWISNVSASFGQPIEIAAFERRGLKFSVGGTASYLIGHALGDLRDLGSLLTEDPLTLNVQARTIYSDDANGEGWAVDLGFALESESLTAGLVLDNLLGNMSWDENAFNLGVVVETAEFGSSSSEDSDLPFDSLDAADQTIVSDYLGGADLPKRLRLGAAYELSSVTTVSADFEELLGGSLRVGWERRLSLGAEWTKISFFPLRAGFATSFEQLAIGGGFGWHVDVVHFDFGIRWQGITHGQGVAASASLSVWPKSFTRRR